MLIHWEEYNYFIYGTSDFLKFRQIPDVNRVIDP